MPSRLVPSLSLVASFLALPVAWGQGGFTPPPPQVSPGWYPRTQRLNDPPVADRAIIDKNLTAAERLITSTTGYARPRGFEGRAHWASSPPQVAGGLRYYYVQAGIFVPAWGSGLNAYATIHFNPSLGLVSEGAMKSETGETYFYERARSSAAYGTPFVYGTFGAVNASLLVLFTAGDEDPMLPVSREEYLRAQIYGLDGEKSKVVGSAGSRTSYQEWMEGAEKRKRDRELSLGQLPREKHDQARAIWEKNDREYAEILKKAEPQEIANRQALSAFDPAASQRAQLAAMTAEERASQAWAGGVALMAEGEPGAKRVVRVKPAFLRARGSPANARAILVVLREPPPVLVTAQSQLHREFDWQALKKLLDNRP